MEISGANLASVGKTVDSVGRTQAAPGWQIDRNWLVSVPTVSDNLGSSCWFSLDVVINSVELLTHGSAKLDRLIGQIVNFIAFRRWDYDGSVNAAPFPNGPVVCVN